MSPGPGGVLGGQGDDDLSGRVGRELFDGVDLVVRHPNQGGVGLVRLEPGGRVCEGQAVFSGEPEQ
ncbi:hypothetical protein [Nocardia sp. CNY236]|uniref:hypothetical protein n=1 Tax=Nocardia sp. CNY236 TaxID=1169152 RepID=UPI00048B65BD|nr:hypothetical protein [Nocardia sp. CNY236]